MQTIVNTFMKELLTGADTGILESENQSAK